jgi:TolB-like protein/Tfp pilus assembly protein PilF
MRHGQLLEGEMEVRILHDLPDRSEAPVAICHNPHLHGTGVVMIGRRIGSYRIVERLGEGATGVVYRACDEALQRDVAIKVLANPGDDPSLLRRFHREALALSRLNHPNVETIHHLDTVDGADCLVLELVAGETLDALLARGPLPELEVLRLGIQLAAGLEAAHAQGVIHRDLKPANLRLTADGRLKILDFGIARHIGREAGTTITARGDTVGTLDYMAPEQLKGGEVDVRSDVWGAGAVLYEMATGTRPFDDPVPGVTMYRILNEALASPRDRNPTVTVALERVIQRALQKDPALRYPNAAALRNDLERALAGDDVAPARKTWNRRRIVVLAGLAVGVVALAVAIMAVTRGWIPFVGRPDIQSIAVLPLTNLSADPGQEYFADGTTDEIIATLGSIGAVRVIARTSVMPYKNSGKSVAQIARELGVDAVVEGSVTLTGDHVRVNANLIRARDQTHLWGGSYQRPLADALALQRDLARSITTEIRARLTPEQSAKLTTPRSVVPEAYRLRLQGRELIGHLNLDSVRVGMALVRRSIVIDSTLAQAYADLAFGYGLLSSATMAPNEALPLMLAETRRALTLDSNLAEAHAMLSVVQVHLEWDRRGAEASLRKALRLNPASTTAHLMYGLLLRGEGRSDEDRHHTKMAFTLDPRSEYAGSQLGWVELFAGRYDAARVEFQASLRTFPNTAVTHAGLGLAAQFLGDTLTARREFEHAVAQAAWVGHKAWLGHLIARADPARARGILAELEKGTSLGYSGTCDRALVHLGLGERERALDLLERGAEEHAEWMNFLAVDPRFDELRKEPRFQTILQRVGLDHVKVRPG